MDYTQIGQNLGWIKNREILKDYSKKIRLLNECFLFHFLFFIVLLCILLLAMPEKIDQQADAKFESLNVTSNRSHYQVRRRGIFKYSRIFMRRGGIFKCSRIFMRRGGIFKIRPLILYGSTFEKVFLEFKSSYRPCRKGTYSISNSRSPCTPCPQCNHGDVIKNCIPWLDTICSSWPKDFYFEKHHSSCLPCSRCCDDDGDIRVNSCIRQGSQYQCSYHSHRRCHDTNRNVTTPEIWEWHTTKSIPAEEDPFSTVTKLLQSIESERNLFDLQSKILSQIIILNFILQIALFALTSELCTFCCIYWNKRSKERGFFEECLDKFQTFSTSLRHLFKKDHDILEISNTNSQRNKLIPTGSSVDSSSFDITLLCFLYRMMAENVEKRDVPSDGSHYQVRRRGIFKTLFTLFLLMHSVILPTECKSLPPKILAESKPTFSVDCPDCIKLEINGTGKIRTEQCMPCPSGQEPSIPCGSTVEIKDFLKLKSSCRPCRKGAYSISDSTSPCTPCSQCNHGDVIKNCTPWFDTICSSCPKDFYFEKQHSSCLPCSRCCGDNGDIIVNSCIRQGSQYQCSYHSHRRCHDTSRNVTTQDKFGRHTIKSVPKEYPTSTVTELLPSKGPITLRTNWTFPSNESERNLVNVQSKGVLKLLFIFFIVFLALILILLTFCCIYMNKRSKKSSFFQEKMLSCFSIRLSRERLSISRETSKDCKGDQSDELEDWAKQDVKKGIYSFKYGAHVKYDTTSKLDGEKNLVVEVLDDPVFHSYLKNLESNQMFVSPIYKYYSQGTQFEKPVEVSLPHSALINTSNQNWDIEVLYKDEREGKDAKWKKVTSEIKVDWNEVSFNTQILLTYAVVGKPKEGAKKRMHLAVFAMKRMVSDLFELVMCLFDDTESSLQRVLKANHSKGWGMVGYLHAVFVDCHRPINMGVQVEDLQEPWSLVHLEPESTNLSQILRESYFDIPQYRGKFRRSKRNAKKFSCKLRVDIGGKETIVPVETFVPEELMCVFVDVHNEDPSIYDCISLLCDLPYDVNYELCRKLDVPVRGRGQWRQLGQLFELPGDLIEDCSREYASLDGSPSMALMKLIKEKRPKATVGELAKHLKKLDRGDALSALKNLKKYDC